VGSERQPRLSKLYITNCGSVKTIKQDRRVIINLESLSIKRYISNLYGEETDRDGIYARNIRAENA